MNDPSQSQEVTTGSDELLGRLLNLQEKSDSLVGKITLQTARDIIEGRLLPGYDLNSIDLAKRFQTSRTPVREALLLLENEGLVEIQARRRPRVSAQSLQQISEIYNLRAQLYALVSQKVARIITDEELAKLEDCLADMRAAVDANDVDKYFWSNVLFHEQAAAFAGDATLKRSLDALGLQVLQFRHVSLSVLGRMRLSVEDHVRLVRAYREGDSDLAGALSRSIIMSALSALTSLLPPSSSEPNQESA